jgi:hypothetical protein
MTAVSRWLALVWVMASGCGGEETEVVAPPTAPCPRGERAVEGLGCLPAGVQDDGCPAGQLGIEGGGCRPAGVPPEACAEGFEPDGVGGCVPVLPAEACSGPQLAVPGDAACHDVAPCAAGTWGDIPVAADTERVDGAYVGGSNDGSQERPWTKIQQAVDAAAAGAIVAIARGSYVEDVSIAGKAVLLWGVCPAEVEIVGSTRFSAVVVLGGASGTEVHDLAVSGGSLGLAVSGALDVVAERLWIHDTADRGLDVEDSLGPAAVMMRGSIIERGGGWNVFLLGASASIEASVVRAARAGGNPQGAGHGIGVQANPGTGQRGSLTLRGSVIEDNREAGVRALGADATIEASVVRRTQPNGSQALGVGVFADRDATTAERAHVAVAGSYVDQSHSAGVVAAASDVVVDATVIRATQPQPADQTVGIGVLVQDDTGGAERGVFTMTASLVDANRTIGVYALGSDVSVEASIVRGTGSQASDLTGGEGIYVAGDVGAGDRASLAVHASLVENNRYAGISVNGSDATVDGTLVRGTEGQDFEGREGIGISIGDSIENASRSTATITASVAENNRYAGVWVIGSDATIDTTAVHDTRSELFGLEWGFGVAIVNSFDTANRSGVTVSRSTIERNHLIGMLVSGSDATLDGLAVRDSWPQESNLQRGIGISVQYDPASGQHGCATIHDVGVERSFDAGITVALADAILEQVLVTGTQPQQNDGRFGDGIAVEVGTADLRGITVIGSPRAGVSNFGSQVRMQGSVLECNTFPLDAEVEDVQPIFEDLGGNSCGCQGVAEDCKILSSGLEPPLPL